MKRKFLITMTISALFLQLTFAQTKLAAWLNVNTSTAIFPFAARSQASFVTSAVENYGNGLVVSNDSRNVWSNPSSATTVTPETSPYVSYSVNITNATTFNRFVVNGLANSNSSLKEQLRWSVDNYATSLGELHSNGSAYTLTSVDLSSNSKVSAGIVTFRVYFYNAVANSFWPVGGPFSTIDGTPTSYSSFGDNVSIWYTTDVTADSPIVDAEKISIYPNPATDAFHIMGLSGVSSISLTNLSGETLLLKQVSDKETVSVSTLPKGVYILKIKNNKGVTERKIVKK